MVVLLTRWEACEPTLGLAKMAQRLLRLPFVLLLLLTLPELTGLVGWRNCCENFNLFRLRRRYTDPSADCCMFCMGNFWFHIGCWLTWKCEGLISTETHCFLISSRACRHEYFAFLPNACPEYLCYEYKLYWKWLLLDLTGLWYSLLSDSSELPWLYYQTIFGYIY